MNSWRRHYESKALGPAGDTLYAVDCAIPIFHRQMMAVLRRIIGDLPEGALVLDAGCGNGLSWQAIFSNRPVFGVDYVHGMCTLASRKGMAVAQGDLLQLPFKAGQFDLIYCAEVLHGR
jgi:ubiquinone/menaquinone biosynthesis C-methylase UbiE